MPLPSTQDVEANQEALEAVNSAVDEAVGIIESASIPLDSRDPRNNSFAWRLRPSQLRAIAVEEYLNPPPVWGLRINLSSLYIGPQNVARIARSLILNKTVTALDLSMCDMGDAACQELFRCLRRNQTLKHLNINGNFIETEGGKAAATCIGRLETLHLSCNRIGDEGCLAIAEALKRSTTIKFLNLRSNGITSYGVFRLLEALDPASVYQINESVLEQLKHLRHRYNAKQKKMMEEKAKAANVQPPAKVMGSHKRSFESLVTLRSRALSMIALTPKNSVNDPVEPIPLPPLDQEHNTSCHALWVQLNEEIAPEITDILNVVLSTRFPQPPEGLNPKKKRKGKKN